MKVHLLLTIPGTGTRRKSKGTPLRLTMPPSSTWQSHTLRSTLEWLSRPLTREKFRYTTPALPSKECHSRDPVISVCVPDLRPASASSLRQGVLSPVVLQTANKWYISAQIQESPKEVFKGGITNGNDWYPVFNGMQDWLYVARGCRALTLELWSSKWPSEELLPVRIALCRSVMTAASHCTLHTSSPQQCVVLHQ
jgi:hypothetical protein